MNRRNALIETNIRCLRQALCLLERIDDATFAASPAGMEPHRAGAHLRHVLEFYQAFLEGVGAGHIDYDARRRDPEMERSRRAAAAATKEIVRELRSSPALRVDNVVFVHIEGALAQSAIDRELQVLSSHTIHHFALIAVTLRLHGIPMPPEFGMAPSTLRYHATRAAEAA
jgi:hypothetical protein